MEELKEQVQDKKQEARNKLIEAKRAAGIGMNGELQQELTNRGVWQQFNTAPSILADLDTEIHSMKARADVMFQVGGKSSWIIVHLS